MVTDSLIDLFANGCQEMSNIKGEMSHLKSVVKNPTGILASRQNSSAMVRNSSSQKLSLIKDRFFSKEGFDSLGPVNNGSFDSGKHKVSQCTFYQQNSKENYILRESSKDTFSQKPDRPKYFTKKGSFDQIIVDADESVRKSDRDDTFFNSRLDTEINTVKKTPRDEETDQEPRASCYTESPLKGHGQNDPYYLEKSQSYSRSPNSISTILRSPQDPGAKTGFDSIQKSPTSALTNQYFQISPSRDLNLKIPTIQSPLRPNEKQLTLVRHYQQPGQPTQPASDFFGPVEALAVSPQQTTLFSSHYPKS